MAVVTIISYAAVYLNMLEKVDAIIRHLFLHSLMHFLLDTDQIVVTYFLNGKKDYEVTVWQKSWSLYRINNLSHFFYMNLYRKFEHKKPVSQWKHMIYANNKRTMKSLYRGNNLRHVFYMYLYRKTAVWSLKTHLVSQWTNDWHIQHSN